MGANSKEKRLAKNTLLYTVSNFGTKILTFLIVPLYTHYIKPEQFGIYDTVISLVNLFAPIVILAIYEGLLRWLLKSEDEPDKILSTGLTIYTLMTIATSALMVIIFIIFPWRYSWHFIALVASATFQMVMQYTARGAKRNSAFAISGVLATSVMLALNVVLVIVFDLGIEGMMISLTSAHMIAGIFLVWKLRDLFSFKRYKWSGKLAKAMLVYSILLVPNTVSWWVMNASSKLMMTAMIGAAATGIYAISGKLPSIVNILHTIFYQAWQEQAVSESDSATRDEYYTKIFRMYVLVSMSLVLVLIPFSKLFITWFMDESYKEGFMYVGVLYIASIFSSFSGFYGIGYISSKDTKRAMTTTIIGALLNLAITGAFLKLIGIWAACIASLVSHLTVWLIRVRQSKRYFSIKIDIKSLLVLTVLCSVMCVAICFTNDIITIILTAAAAVVALWFNRGFVCAILDAVGKKLRKN